MLRLNVLPSRFSYFVKVIPILIIIMGIKGFDRLRIYDKLLTNPVMEWWDFKNSSAEFFLYYTCVSGMVISLTYYSSKYFKR